MNALFIEPPQENIETEKIKKQRILTEFSASKFLYKFSHTHAHLLIKYMCGCVCMCATYHICYGLLKKSGCKKSKHISDVYQLLAAPHSAI